MQSHFARCSKSVHGVKLVFAHIAQGTGPVIRYVVKGSTGGNALARIALLRIVDIAAVNANIFHDYTAKYLAWG